MKKIKKDGLFFLLVLNLVIFAIIVNIFLFVKDPNLKNAQKLKDFDIEISATLNLMPGSDNKQAYFIIWIRDYNYKEFLKNYKIETINLNGINIRKIYYPDDSKSYGDIRFYSKYYKRKNDIIIIIKDKKTKKKYYKKIVTFTEEIN